MKNIHKGIKGIMDAVINNGKKNNTAFVACIESGVLEQQALLLFESIRRYSRRFQDSPIYAVTPRKGDPISRASLQRMNDLNVGYINMVMIKEHFDYGPINRILAAAYIEENFKHDTLVVLDSDTLFLREPSELELPQNVDVAARPVDMIGISTDGSAGAADTYWRSLCTCYGINYEDIPWCQSSVDQKRIKANYNTGLIVARANLGIMQKCRDFFFKALNENITPPYENPGNLRTGAGWIQPAAAKLWGSSQAIMSLAIWNSTTQIMELPATYNYPLHLHQWVNPKSSPSLFEKLVHTHYHWLFMRDAIITNPLFDKPSPLTEEQREWLQNVTPFN